MCPRRPAVPLLLFALALVTSGCGGCRGSRPADTDWPAHGGDPGHRQYSPLAQIDRSNVAQLQVAWTYRAGEASDEGRSQIQCHPIVVDGVLYGTSPQLTVFALDAATGRELWRFDPFEGGRSIGVNRGVVYWGSGDDRRIFMAAGSNLLALNAANGRPIETFGTGGRVSLKEGLGRDVSDLHVVSNTPGAIYEDLIIVGTSVSEGPAMAAPGHLRAYDVRTGAMRWIFHTIPHPGEPGYETWPPDAWQRIGGANAWSGISVDPARGLVFIPTGSAAFDFWGGNRHGDNLYANSVIALKAATGERVWHYQTVRHDVWDRDLPAAPVLVTVTHDGRRVDAVAQVTKSGHVFVFDRENGTPLFPIEEVPVTPSDLEGESLAATQPVPVKPPPFSRQSFSEADVTDISPASREAVLERFRRARSGGLFVPPSTEGTIIFPGFDGGGEWGGSAFDESTGILYVNGNEMPWLLEMVPIDRSIESTTVARGRRIYQLNCAVCHGRDRQGDPLQTFPAVAKLAPSRREEVSAVIRDGKGKMPAFAMLSENQRRELVAFLYGDKPVATSQPAERMDDTVPFAHTGYNRFLDPDGYPAVKPPWGTLNAIDLNAGTIKWQVPFGELPELVAKGRPRTGAENYGGPIVTAGGLIFIGATKDEKFRAFDKDTGEVLFETSLPAGGYATPSTYSVGGRQYVVIAAGGGKMGTKSGDAYVAFALP